eukprot:gnl/Chilomastix_cuspidata/3869.p1 GENE.gnl/Chilomastix_cuspidata/3869~~gnl/Chilomastix_cuspidata/3869.p1  ORF type:complete len:1088 (+),score=431.03 gnl/Chilomastix_cuspidata/3869:1309-4572(+)
MKPGRDEHPLARAAAHSESEELSSSVSLFEPSAHSNEESLSIEVFHIQPHARKLPIFRPKAKHIERLILHPQDQSHLKGKPADRLVISPPASPLFQKSPSPSFSERSFNWYEHDARAASGERSAETSNEPSGWTSSEKPLHGPPPDDTHPPATLAENPSERAIRLLRNAMEETRQAPHGPQLIVPQVLFATLGHTLMSSGSGLKRKFTRATVSSVQSFKKFSHQFKQPRRNEELRARKRQNKMIKKRIKREKKAEREIQRIRKQARGITGREDTVAQTSAGRGSEPVEDTARGSSFHAHLSAIEDTTLAESSEVVPPFNATDSLSLTYDRSSDSADAAAHPSTEADPTLSLQAMWAEAIEALISAGPAGRLSRVFSETPLRKPLPRPDAGSAAVKKSKLSKMRFIKPKPVKFKHAAIVHPEGNAHNPTASLVEGANSFINFMEANSAGRELTHQDLIELNQALAGLWAYLTHLTGASVKAPVFLDSQSKAIPGMLTNLQEGLLSFSKFFTETSGAAPGVAEGLEAIRSMFEGLMGGFPHSIGGEMSSVPEVSGFSMIDSLASMPEYYPQLQPPSAVEGTGNLIALTARRARQTLGKHRHLIRVISDTHIGSDWFNEKSARLLNEMLNDLTDPHTSVDTLVVLGDFIEIWLQDSSETLVSPAEIVQLPLCWHFFRMFQKIAINGVRVIIVCGNHDDELREEHIRIVDPQGLIQFCAEDELVFNGVRMTHGHEVDLFNKKDEKLERPLGYFVSRIVAHQRSVEDQPPELLIKAATKAGNRLISMILRPISSPAISSKFTGLILAAPSKGPWEKLCTERVTLPNSDKTITLDEVRSQYSDLMSRSRKKYGSHMFGAMVRASITGSYGYWVRRSQFLVEIRGHTHIPALDTFLRRGRPILGEDERELIKEIGRNVRALRRAKYISRAEVRRSKRFLKQALPRRRLQSSVIYGNSGCWVNGESTFIDIEMANIPERFCADLAGWANGLPQFLFGDGTPRKPHPNVEPPAQPLGVKAAFEAIETPQAQQPLFGVRNGAVGTKAPQRYRPGGSVPFVLPVSVRLCRYTGGGKVEQLKAENVPYLPQILSLFNKT